MINYDEVLKRRLQQLQQEGNYRHFLDMDKNAGDAPYFQYKDNEGTVHRAINWCSNDYLGMGTHREVIEAMIHATATSGAGSGGTRNISGNTTWHRLLEQELALLHRKENALVFNSAYLANVTTLCTIGKIFPDMIFLSDEQNHASIIEGIRNSGNKKIIFRHNDAFHLEQILEQIPPATPKIIVFESVYSMSGNIAPVKKIASIARKYNSLTYIDEVHAVGLYGNTGEGYTGQTGTQDDIDIINGTLAKGFGVAGGYIAGSSNIIDNIRSYGNGFIFTTSLPPAICAAALKSVQLVRADESIRRRFHDNVTLLKANLSRYGIGFHKTGTHIIRITIGNPFLCRKIANYLLEEHGVYMQPVNYPTVAKGSECLRLIVTARHKEKDIQHVAEALYLTLGKYQEIDPRSGASLKLYAAGPEQPADEKNQYPVSGCLPA